MDYSTRLSISYYKTIAEISKEHRIYIVQHIHTHKIYIKKVLTVYNKSIYEYLQKNPVPHTPKIYVLHEENYELTIIEEYISGDTLEQLLENKVTFSTELIRSMMIQLCTILSELHHCQPPIIHRDIKPSNIILTPSGEVYLLDFNAAKYHSTHKEEDTRLLGTKGYAAPEQYGFGVSTIQTDIYAVGMLLNTLVTGTFSQNPCTDSEFSPIIAKCTRLQASERYKDMDAVLHLLQKSDHEKNKTRSDLPTWVSFLPPGFRSLSPFNMIFSSVGYFFVFWLCLSLEVKNATPVALYIERGFCLLIFLSIIFCTANYRNIQSYFPPCRTKNKLLKILSVLLLDVLIFFSLMFIMIFIVSNVPV